MVMSYALRWGGIIVVRYCDFVVLLRVFESGSDLFRTAWFFDSTATQVLVIFVIHTHAPSGRVARVDARCKLA